MAADHIAPLLTILFDESLATGKLLNEFKVANLFPLLKRRRADTTLLTNYRGISFTCITSKVLEKLVLDQLYEFLNKHAALSNLQFGL